MKEFMFYFPRCPPGRPLWLSDKRSTCQARRHGLNPWRETKIPQGTWCSQKKVLLAALVVQKRTHLLIQETQEMRVQSLGWEESLEKEMATHSSILAWKTLWAEEPGGLQPMGPLKSQTKRLLSDQTSPLTMSTKSPLQHCIYLANVFS